MRRGSAFTIVHPGNLADAPAPCPDLGGAGAAPPALCWALTAPRKGPCGTALRAALE